MADRMDENRAMRTSNRNEEGLSPAQVMERAGRGDTVRFTPRGPELVPVDPEEAAAMERAFEEQYPGVDFEIDTVYAVQSRAVVVRRDRAS